jgi:hypothetical protein
MLRGGGWVQQRFTSCHCAEAAKAAYDENADQPLYIGFNEKDDVRIVLLPEDATEFHLQGSEPDWACIAGTRDSDTRPTVGRWSFRGNGCNERAAERQRYLKNAYRVLLTRARQDGGGRKVPEGTRKILRGKPRTTTARSSILPSGMSLID